MSCALSENTSSKSTMSVSPFELVTTHWLAGLGHVVRRHHPVERLVRAGVGVDGDASVGLHHHEPHTGRQHSRQPPAVGDRAARDD